MIEIRKLGLIFKEICSFSRVIDGHIAQNISMQVHTQKRIMFWKLTDNHNRWDCTRFFTPSSVTLHASLVMNNTISNYVTNALWWQNVQFYH